MNSYQKQAARTLWSKPEHPLSDLETMLVWCIVGLSGEVGEVTEHIKKGVFHQHGVDPEKLKLEIGDCMWYIAGLCTTMGFDLDEIMWMNVDKLRKRYPDGFSIEESKHNGSD